MALNLFSGARRIAAMTGSLWLAGTVYAIAWPSPYVSIDYVVEAVGDKPVLLDSVGRCNSTDGNEYLSRTLPGLGSVNVTLCFRAYDGLVPYAKRHRPESPFETSASNADERSIKSIVAQGGTSEDVDVYLRTYAAFSGRAYSDEVKKYTDSVAASFAVDDRGVERARVIRASRARESRVEAARFGGIGLAIGWLVVFATGWIVRGFLGIPRGKDFREPPTASSH